MKWLALSCFLSLALVAGEARAQMREQRGAGAAQQVHAVRESPRIVHTSPAVRERPSTTVNRPMHLVGPAARFSSRQNFIGGSRGLRRFQTNGYFHHGYGHYYRGGRSHYIIVYVNGVACWYPFYTAYPYYYDYYAAPLAPTYDSGYYDSGASTAPYVDDNGDEAAQTAPSYGELGQEWGQDLRREVATWDDFVDYLRTYIVVAPPDSQAEFREAFVASYGINGAAAYDKAAQEAAQSSTPDPKVINVSPAH